MYITSCYRKALLGYPPLLLSKLYRGTRISYITKESTLCFRRLINEVFVEKPLNKRQFALRGSWRAEQSEVPLKNLLSMWRDSIKNSYKKPNDIFTQGFPINGKSVYFDWLKKKLSLFREETKKKLVFVSRRKF